MKRYGIIWLFAALLVAGPAHAVKTGSLQLARTTLERAAAANDPQGILRAIQMARTALDAPRPETLLLQGQGHFQLAWQYFLNDERQASLDTARQAIGLLNQSLQAAGKPSLPLAAWRSMSIALLRELDAPNLDGVMLQQAADDREFLLNNRPDDPLNLYARGLVAYLTGYPDPSRRQREEAQGAFAALLRQDPANRTWQAFSLALSAMDDPARKAEAAAALTDMLQKDPGFRLAAFLRGRL